MEENESQNQQSEEWQGGLEPRTEVPVAAMEVEVSLPKNPETTPTAELVADYEALLAEIKSRKANHDDNLASLDAMRAEAIAAYENGMKGASVEAAKLLVVISKRLGMPLNGRPEAQSVSQQRRLAVQTGQPTPTACPVCHKEFRNGLGMHLTVHKRKGETAANYVAEGERRSHHATGGQQTRWCEKCGTAIHVKGWAAHQAAHQRHGNVLPRKVDHGSTSRIRYGQSMGDEKIRTMLVTLRKAQPIGSKAFGEQYHAGKNISAFLTGLKERGLAINNDMGKWTITPKGAALIS